MSRSLRAGRSGSIGLALAVAVLGIVIALAASSALRTRSGPPSIPAGVTGIRADTDFRYCSSPEAADLVLSAFQLENGPAMWAAFPKHGISPELDGVRQPLNVAVYPDGWPGVTTGQFGHEGEKAEPGPRAGTVDICVETTDGSDGISGEAFIVYANVSVEDSVIAGLLQE